MSGLAVEIQHSSTPVGIANRLPVTAEVTGTVAVSGSFTPAAGTEFFGRTGRLVVRPSDSVAPSGTITAWQPGQAIAAASPALLEFDFGATYASRFVELASLSVVASLVGEQPLDADLVLSDQSAASAASDGDPWAISAAHAVSAVILRARSAGRGASWELAQWSGGVVAQLDANGKLYGQLAAGSVWNPGTTASLFFSAYLAGVIL